MSPIGLSILFVVVLVVVVAPRRWALFGIMAAVLYLTQGQQWEVAGFNLYAMRFVELAGFSRVVARREFSFANLNRIDRALLILYGYVTIVFLLRSNGGQAYEIGVAVDAFLSYFTFRGLMRDMDEFRWFLRASVFLLAPYVMLVAAERLTGHNPFASMGGVADGTWIREGKVRCWGSFRHPSLLGTLGVSFAPLYFGLAFSKENRRRAVAGLALCLVVVLLSNSGGPVSALAISSIAWVMWRFRTSMRTVRRLIAAGIILLAIVMKAPVWYLIMHVSNITGGDGWHRAKLIDVAVNNLDQWWFAGMPIESTVDWLPYFIERTGAADITNQFVSFGIQAGLGAIALFIFLLTRSFSSLGIAMAAVRAQDETSNKNEAMLWGLGAVLITHVVNWLGITYFDQTYVIWFMQLAAISTLTELVMKTAIVSEFTEERQAPQLEPVAL